MDPSIVVAAFGALGTIISAWLVYRVQLVQRTVNGHTRLLEARIDELQAQLVRTSLEVVPPAGDKLV